MRGLDKATMGAGVKLVIFIVVTTLATSLLVVTIGNISFTGKKEYRAEFVDATGVVLSDGRRIESETVVWTAGVAANPLVGELGLPCDERGRVEVDETLQVVGMTGVWALGDCAAVPNAATKGALDPATCQHALRQARRLLLGVARTDERAVGVEELPEPIPVLGRVGVRRRNAEALELGVVLDQPRQVIAVAAELEQLANRQPRPVAEGLAVHDQRVDLNPLDGHQAPL